MRRRLPRPLRPSLVLAGLLVGPLAGLAAPASAQGTPRSMAECERLKNDLAYNQCLAMFGPPARNVAGGDGAGGGSVPPVPGAPLSLPAATAAPTATTIAGIPTIEEPILDERGGRRGRRGRRGGRQSMSFQISGAIDEAAESTAAATPRGRRHRRHR